MAEGIKGGCIACNSRKYGPNAHTLPLKINPNGVWSKKEPFRSKTVQNASKMVDFEQEKVVRVGGYISYKGVMTSLNLNLTGDEIKGVLLSATANEFRQAYGLATDYRHFPNL